MVVMLTHCSHRLRLQRNAKQADVDVQGASRLTGQQRMHKILSKLSVLPRCLTVATGGRIQHSYKLECRVEGKRVRRIGMFTLQVYTKNQIITHFILLKELFSFVC